MATYVESGAVTYIDKNRNKHIIYPINRIQDVEGLTNEFDTVNARMDTFTKLAEGSTTGDAELQDIRVGADGTTYETAGAAVRGQVNDLYATIDEVAAIKETVVSGGSDYGEVGVWEDGNPSNEDRLYRFVTVVGDNREIKIADSNDQIVGTSNLKANVGFLGNYSEGAENEANKAIVSILGVSYVKTNDNTITANDRVMSDDNGYAVKSSNNCGYRVLKVVETGLLEIVVSPNTDMIQRARADVNALEGLTYKKEVESSGNIQITDGANYKNLGIKLYGKSVQNGTPTPDAPVEIQSVVNPSIKLCGKNLLGYTKEHVRGTINGVIAIMQDDGSFKFSGTAISNSFPLSSLKADDIVKENIKKVTYNSSKVSFFINYADGTTSGYLSGNTVFTIPDGKIFKECNFYIEKNTDANNIIIYPTFVGVNDDTTYEPYQGSQATLPYTLNAIPVSSGGNVTIDGQEYIADYVDIERKKLYKYISKLNLGSLDWTMNISSMNIFNKYFSGGINSVKNSVKANILCSNYAPAFFYNSGTYMGDKKIAYNQNNIFIRDSSYTDATELKNALSGVIMYYLLNTPTEVSLTDDEVHIFEQLQTYIPTTNVISSSDQLTPYTKFTYVVDTQKYIDSTDDKIDTLENKVDNADTALDNRIDISDNKIAKLEALAIKEEVEGTNITVNDSADYWNQGITLFGRSEKFNQLVKNGNFENTDNWGTVGASISASNNILTVNKSSTTDFYVRQSVSIISGHKYLLIGKCKLTTASSSVLRLIYDYGNNVFGEWAKSTTDWQTISKIFTTRNNYNGTVVWRMASSSEDTSFLVSNTMLFDLTQLGIDNITTVEEFKALYPLDYYPYYDYGIKSVVNPSMKLIGKNLLNSTLETATKNGVTCTNNGDGTYTLNGTASARCIFPIASPFKLLANTYRVIFSQMSDNARLICSKKDYASGDVFVCYTETSVTLSEDITAYFYINVSVGATLNNLVVKPMLTIDTSLTYDDFEQFAGEQTATLPYTLNAIPVSDGGNVTIDGQQYIADYVDIEDKKLVRMVDKIVFDGSTDEEWYKNNEDNNNYLYWVRFVQKKAQLLCDKLKYFDNVQDINNDNNVTHLGISNNNDAFYINIGHYMSDNSISQLNMYLQSNPITVYYPLIEPTITDLTDEEVQVFKDLSTYYGTTNIINSSDDLSGACKFVYVADTKMYIDNKINALA